MLEGPFVVFADAFIALDWIFFSIGKYKDERGWMRKNTMCQCLSNRVKSVMYLNLIYVYLITETFFHFFIEIQLTNSICQSSHSLLNCLRVISFRCQVKTNIYTRADVKNSFTFSATRCCEIDTHDSHCALSSIICHLIYNTCPSQKSIKIQVVREVIKSSHADYWKTNKNIITSLLLPERKSRLRDGW
jgi:hypothetical protein